MVKIELKVKPTKLILRLVCVLIVIIDIIVIIISLTSSADGEKPSFFGTRLYLVNTDAFSLISKGTAISIEEVPFDEIDAGNIVVYKNNANKSGIAEVLYRDHSDGVYTYTARSDRGNDLVLSQSQIVGKAMNYSNFLGLIIRLVKSPAGMFIIAVLPCLALLLYEGAKYILARINKESFDPVKKQDEIPTFIPRQKVSPIEEKFAERERKGQSERKPRHDLDEESDEVPAPRRNMSAYQVGAYTANKQPQRTLPESRDLPLFTPPRQEKIAPAAAAPKRKPLSQKRLNEVIAETNAKRERELFTPPPRQTRPTATIDKTAELTDVSVAEAQGETIKQYTPRSAKRTSQSPRLSQTSSIPRLDQLLNDDD